MSERSGTDLRRGWTTGACATAATRAALTRLWSGSFPDQVTITLPRGETPVFDLAHRAAGENWAEAGIVKDAGDDPDVTHGSLVIARVDPVGDGVTFAAGDGIGTVTKPGLPIPPGEPAINPVPRQMMRQQVETMADQFGRSPDIRITISIPGGDIIAEKTWNPRLGIKGGLSILGTTGVVRPFSCSAWIASIHRGIDVARAGGLDHVAGCTGATSEKIVQAELGLPDHAMLDMGDFAGGMLKYLRKHPIQRVTIGGGIGKISKLAQGAMDLHSGRSQVDLTFLAALAGNADITKAETALHALEIAGPELANAVAVKAQARVAGFLAPQVDQVEIIIVSRKGNIIGRAD